jgi:type 1 glutamine amidotransferase
MLIASMLLLGMAVSGRAAEDKKKIVFIAGPGSHGFANHAYHAGFLLFGKLLNENAPNVQAVVLQGWPKDAAVLDDAAAIVLGSDGGGLVHQNLAALDKLAKKGVGLACIHYTLDVPKGKVGQFMLDAIGGYYEQHWSVNPTWEADFKEFPKHPIANGVKPFKISDEWYFHMRFVEDMKGVTPVLTTIPPDGTKKGGDGAHSGNPTVRLRLGMPEHVGWAYERPDGGRGFGCTAGHVHWNWGHDQLRKVMLNAFLWVAKAEVPPDGVPSKTPTVEELAANQHAPMPKDFKPEKIQQMLDRWNKPSPAP